MSDTGVAAADRPRRRRTALVVGGAVALLAALLAFVNWDDEPQFGDTGTGCIAMLRHLGTIEFSFKAQGAVDLDGDGTGEYGFPREFDGIEGVRATSDGSTRGARLRTPLLPRVWADAQGVWLRSGHFVRVFLPGTDGAAVHQGGAESGSDGGRVDLAFSGSVDTEAAESTWCAYGWPAMYMNSGKHAFFADSSGAIWWSENDGGLYSGLERRPDALAASAPGAEGRLGVAAGPDRPARDGQVWKRLR